MALSPQERSRRMRLNMLMAMSYAVAGRTTFTPLSLFSAGEVGAWYDPSDFSTMFQDSAGTTPVTAVEQPVGLIRDKSGRGNHASQTTSTSRPVLSARVNLLTYTEQFDNAAWTKLGATISSNSTTDPLGGNTADQIVDTVATSAHGLSGANITVVSGASYVWSAYVKSAGRQWVFINASDGANNRCWFDLTNGVTGTVGAGCSAAITSAGNGWYRISVTRAAGTSTCVFAVYMATADNSISYTGDGASGVYLWGADFRPTNQSTGLPNYQRVAASTDYDTTGFPYYLSFDGTDDFLVTGTINPGSVDKAQVFAGVRKLSDAAANTVVELSASGTANAGTFTIFSASSASTYYFRSRGSNVITGATTPASYASPITNVLTGIGDIAADVSSIRVNGANAGSDGSDQGTGNYLSYPLYIGRRGGTTLPFNGRLFGLIVRFSAANMSDADIARTETWLNARTGAY